MKQYGIKKWGKHENLVNIGGIGGENKDRKFEISGVYSKQTKERKIMRNSDQELIK